MIVTCERCATQFELDDTRVPEGGVRVRCSRCKHAFEIRRPEPAPERPAPATPAAAQAPEEEESDWQFNEDPPGRAAQAGEASLDATHVVDDLLGGDGPQPPAGRAADEFDLSAAPSGLELEGGLPPPSIEPAPAAAAEPPPAEERRRTEPGRVAGAGSGPGGDGTGGIDLGLEDPAGAHADTGDELQSPEDWDALEDGEEPAPTDFGVAMPQGAAVVDVDPDELIDDRPRWQGWLFHAGNAAGWVLVVTLFGVGLYAGLRPPAVLPSGPIPVAQGLEVRQLSGHLIDHVDAGPIYVVTGRVANLRSTAVTAPRLGVEPVDAAGEPVAAPALLHSLHAAAELRETPLDQLALARDPTPAHLRPGEARSFEAVIGPLPENARRLQVVPVGGPMPLHADARPGPDGVAQLPPGSEGAGVGPDRLAPETAGSPQEPGAADGSAAAPAPLASDPGSGPPQAALSPPAPGSTPADRAP